MAHLCMQPVKIDSKLVEERFWNDEFKETRGRFIRDAFMAGRAAYDQLNNLNTESWIANDVIPKYRADIRTALRTLVVHGQDNRLSRPDDEDLIWDGDLRWRHSDGRKPSCEEFDWLVDYLAGDAEHRTDDETEGDALLALSSMQGLGSSTKQQSYISSLIRFDKVSQNGHFLIGFYLLVVFWRIKSSGKDLPFSPTQENWRSLVKNTWETLEIVTWSDNAIDGIPAIVTLTRLNLTASDNGVPREWFTDLAAIVHKVLVKSQREQATLVNNGIGQAAIDTALSSIQGLHDDLGCVIDQRNASQRVHNA
ncbi:hypothetical protein P692DRAFT_20814223 [Suillus brevipes Sb2]|nr:hypothetical protein P692DRAFT_20814223 [Suillus brevipes Sb2]